MPEGNAFWRHGKQAIVWVALGACTPMPGVGGVEGGGPESFELDECPRHWERLPKRLGGRVAPVGFALTREITDVPEFNDCQRLLVDEGTAFGPLVAVFASITLASLDSLYDTSSITPPDTALAAGLILNLDLEAYQPLRILPGFSCLYLWPDTGDRVSRRWHAAIISVDTAQGRCTEPRVVSSLPVGNLDVHRVTSQDPAGSFPPVARWEWIQESKQHSIVIGCGHGSCEIGSRGFVSPQPYLALSTPGPREMRIKGWYDDQLLAVPTGDGGLRPSAVRGILFPIGGSVQVTALANRASSSNPAARWDTVAFIAIDKPSPYYKRMLNLEPVPQGASFTQMNMLSFCLGIRSVCGVPDAPSPALLVQYLNSDLPRLAPKSGCDKGEDPVIWVRITPAGSRPGGEGDMYRCVTRKHHGFSRPIIPATARWRWLISDETVWRECTQGCCEVEADG